MLTFKIWLYFALTIAFSLGFILLVHVIGASLFNNLALVEPESGTIDEWVQGYVKFAGWYGIGITSVSTILWYILCQWVFRVVSYEKAGKRGLWIAFFLFPLAGAILGLLVLMFHPIVFGFHWVVLFTIIIPFLCYWLVTVLLSPISYKTTPWGAKWIRYW